MGIKHTPATIRKHLETDNGALGGVIVGGKIIVSVDDLKDLKMGADVPEAKPVAPSPVIAPAPAQAQASAPAKK